MGRNQVELKVTAALSSHNSEQDEIDEALWEEIEERIKAIISESRYEDIRPMAW